MHLPEAFKRIGRPILRHTLYAKSVYHPRREDRPFYIRLDITNICNQACVKCSVTEYMRQGNPTQFMSVPDFRRLAERLFPYAHFLQIPFSFEALVHPKFAELAAIADSYDIPTMGVVTNGTLLNGERAEALIRSRSFHGLNVSLDGLNPETYRRMRGGAQLKQVLENIVAFQRRKRQLGKVFPHLKVNCVMARSNLRELPEIARWCVNNQVEEMEFFHVEPTDLSNEESLLHDKEGYNIVHEKIGKALEGSGLRVFLPAPFVDEDFDPLTGTFLRRFYQGVKMSEFDTSGVYVRESYPNSYPSNTFCINPWMVLVIDAYGNLRPCSHRGALPPFSNILHQDMEAAMNSIRILKLRRDHLRWKHDSICAGCKSKTPSSDPMKWRQTRRLEPVPRIIQSVEHSEPTADDDKCISSTQTETANDEKIAAMVE